MGSQNRTRKLYEHSSTLNAFMSPKGSEFEDLFQGDMFSYQSSLPRNWNHSIWMKDDQVMAKTQSLVEGKKN